MKGGKAKLLIIGDSAFAEIAYEYFTHDSEHEVVAFGVEKTYLKRDELFGLPVVAFEDLPRLYPPGRHSFFVAVTYLEKNSVRQRLYLSMKERGYAPASYISSHAFVWRNCGIGEHVFIFENNVVQPFAVIGDNVVMWSGNHIGHHSKIGDHCFISSHVVISGFVDVGEHCFLGVNATVSNNIKIGTDCIIGAGALILSDVTNGQTAVGLWTRRSAS